MDVVLLSRLQFAFTIMFHYIFPSSDNWSRSDTCLSRDQVLFHQKTYFCNRLPILDKNLCLKLRNWGVQWHSHGVPVRNQLGDLFPFCR